MIILYEDGRVRLNLTIAQYFWLAGSVCFIIGTLLA